MRDKIYANHCEPIPRVTLRLAEAAKSLGISERALWSLTKSGDIPHVPYGRITLYPVKGLFEWAEIKSRSGDEGTEKALSSRKGPGGCGDDLPESK